MAESLIAWINTLALHGFVQETQWVVPAVQTLHILGISVVFASSLVLTLRSLELVGGEWTPARWVHRLGGWIWGALLLLLLSGLLLIIGEPGRTLDNRVFQLKIVLLIVATGTALLLLRRMSRLSGGPSAAIDRLLAIGLMLLWAAIIAAGRWIAYS